MIINSTQTEVQQQQQQQNATAATRDISMAQGFLIANLVLLIISILMLILVVYLINKLNIEIMNQYNNYRFYNHVIRSPSRQEMKKDRSSYDLKTYQYEQRTPKTVEYEPPTTAEEPEIQAQYEYPVTSSNNNNNSARKKLSYGQRETFQQEIKMKRSKSWDINNKQSCTNFSSMYKIHNRTNDLIVDIDEEL